ncbi:fumarylacetoacetate (FAA) hydrolase family protein [Nocardia nova SH22a]|uniref:Fumarylacetoacetate (FAA) hydrolase family protein n=1 Tax=Nocardia nova SH22a TaxID=1415166 RepID=W5TGS1_9NOCA|nr:fumarylacetoacetate hydrolase family protein [Nocardia nova]AHH18565.1 fumarylacetoacetate (FAA) hydrolase family protein [Nocardia nova SH22a]
MRIANLSGRLVLISADGSAALDVEQASSGRFGPDPQSIYEVWEEFAAWAADADAGTGKAFAVTDLGAPVPAPRQVLAIGLNYSEHASESGFSVPEQPTVMFTKWVSCLSGPVTQVQLPPDGKTDWEVELVAVIGTRAYQISPEQAWDHVAGLTVGQDISERVTQTAGPSPQFSLGKSLPGFGPTGPWVVTADEFDNRDDLEIGCSVNGEQMQKGRTRDLIFSVPALIAALSQKIPLLPGDLLFTGTPAGVGAGRTPQRFLQPGDELVSYISGIGELRQQFVAS